MVVWLAETEHVKFLFEQCRLPKLIINDNTKLFQNLRCFIEDSKPLKLTLTGMCNLQPTTKENVSFTTSVRQTETRNLMLSNRSVVKDIIDKQMF